MMEYKNSNTIGLTTLQAETLQKEFGKNIIVPEKKDGFFHKIVNIIKEPMFLLLIAAAIVYFILGEPKDGLIMLVFVVCIISIEAVQEWRTDKTLKALRNLSAPKITVFRDGTEKIIDSYDLVPGDVMIIIEGVKIPADGIVIKSSTLGVDEASLSGESETVWKEPSNSIVSEDNTYWRKDYCYAGTLVTQGTGLILVDKIGQNTEYGKIGQNIMAASDVPTPLQLQMEKLVKFSGLTAVAFFILVTVVTYFNIPDHLLIDRVIESLLSGITLAMAMIPEEIPVILTVFLSMGAWRLSKKQSLVRKLASVETLGAISVLCVDKTGTITMNKMKVQECWSFSTDEQELIWTMGLGCEPDAYDPMEKAMISYCEERGISRDELFSGELITEYPFTAENKMMGHVWKNDKGIIVAAKGSPEHVLTICDITGDERELTEMKIKEMSSHALRVIAVGQMKIKKVEDIPANIMDCKFKMCGLIGLADPPRESIKNDIAICNDAGVRVVMITGDNGLTASAIAKQIGMPNNKKIITGYELDRINDSVLEEKIKDVNIFSRVLPEHKMRIVRAFKNNGAIVAMTGDGVNDAPALKYADIGIAMGKRGSEVSREAADLILLDDNFSTIIDTIKDGRRIYDNIKKAVEYVFIIHIPIAFSAVLAPLLGVSPINLLLLPIHVVLLELVIDPTCSIILERQPAEKNIMNRPPRAPHENIITFTSLIKSIIQGLVIFSAAFGTYFMFLKQYPNSADIARTLGLTIIFISNILLVQVNSSKTELFVDSFMKLINDKFILAVNIAIIISLLIIIYSPIHALLKLAPLSCYQMIMAIGVSCLAVLWYEFVKLYKLYFR